MIRAVVTGVGGRMGQVLARVIEGAADFKLVGATVREGAAGVGGDVGALVGGPATGVQVSDRLSSALRLGAQVVIDFTTPEATVEHARVCAEEGVALVIGTTGLTEEGRAEVARCAARIPVVLAPNTSVGVNVVLKVAGELARALGEGYDVEIAEVHHRKKKDAPSGTALKLAGEIAAALGRGPESFRLAREGQVGARPAEEIGIQALRGGDVVGEHTVFFFGEGERVELTHRATHREQFATGALRAARWLIGRAPGLYDMKDVLGFRR